MPASAPARLARANSLALSPSLLRLLHTAVPLPVRTLRPVLGACLQRGQWCCPNRRSRSGSGREYGSRQVPNRTAQGLHLVVGPGVFEAGQRRWTTGAKLFVEVHRERFDGAQPRCRKRPERRRRWSPLAGSRAAEVGRRRRRRIASVTRPPCDDSCRCVLADRPALIRLGQAMIRQEREVFP